jgi:predicted O-methyltransferase YrrM
VATKIELKIAPALETLSQLERRDGGDQFDLAFIDADKTCYDVYYECALRLVRPAGLIDGRPCPRWNNECRHCQLQIL